MIFLKYLDFMTPNYLFSYFSVGKDLAELVPVTIDATRESLEGVNSFIASLNVF